jgi:hypothetical protein
MIIKALVLGGIRFRPWRAIGEETQRRQHSLDGRGPNVTVHLAQLF